MLQRVIDKREELYLPPRVKSCSLVTESDLASLKKIYAWTVEILKDGEIRSRFDKTDYTSMQKLYGAIAGLDMKHDVPGMKT